MSRVSSHFAALSVLRALHKLGTVAASPTLQANMVSMFAAGEPEEQPGSSGFWMKLLFSLILVLLGGVFAGLTIGLMGLDELHLRVLAVSSDDETERKNAKKVLHLLRKGRHWVLVVLLLGNVIVNESLPIFLDSAIGGGVAAVVISTALIVIFGIIPQAACARYGLTIGAKCAPVVLGFMYILAPIAWPTAKLLDYVLGSNEAHTYKKAELRSFLQFHRHGEEPLRDDEIAILNGVLELNSKTVIEIMTPIQDVLTVSADAVLDHELVDKLLASGYSRFPVYEPGNQRAFVGLLLIKKMLTYDPSERKRISEFPLSILPEAGIEINCFQALDYFQTGRAHLLIVSKTPGVPGGAIGVVTLEDIIEEIIAEEIVDEFDRFEDNHSKRRAKRRGTADVMKGIVEHVKRRANQPVRVRSSDSLVVDSSLDAPSSFVNEVAHPPSNVQSQQESHGQPPGELGLNETGGEIVEGEAVLHGSGVSSGSTTPTPTPAAHNSGLDGGAVTGEMLSVSPRS